MDAGQIVLTVVVVAGFSGVLTWISARKKAQSWEGVVADIRSKKIDRNSSQDGPAIYEEQIIIYYKTDAGGNGKLKITSGAFGKYFPDLKIGDRLVKKAGQYMPETVKAEG